MSMLTVHELTRRFGGVQALADVTFSIQAAELFAVIGPNGAGKTTLLNLICGVEAPSSGRVHFKGADITGQAPWRTAAGGLVRTLQKPSVVPDLTVRQNVALGHVAQHVPSFLGSILGTPSARRWERDAHEKAAAVLDRLGIAAYADRPAGALPHAVLRLVEVGRALVAEPCLLLLDEPAAGLSREEVDNLAELLVAVAAEGVSVCLVEHNMRLVMGVADRVLVLNQGRSLFEGTPAEVTASEDVVDAYLGRRGTTGLEHVAL